MRRNFIGKPHRFALTAATVAALSGIVLLATPWEGVIVALAWALIIGGVIAAALTLFLIRTPSS